MNGVKLSNLFYYITTMKNISQTAIKDEALRRGWKFEQVFADDAFYKITNEKGEWRLGRGSRLGRSNANGMAIASDKLRTYEFLESIGIRTVPYVEVTRLSDVLKFMKQYSSVAIKPRNAEQGQGVSVGVDTEEKARAALKYARKYSSKGIVAQTQLKGDLYRVLVVGARVVAAARRRATEVNTKIPTGHTKESENVTHQVHPSLARALVDVVGTLELSICGFDIIMPDLASFRFEGYLPVLEINSMPGLRSHLFPMDESQSLNPAPFILDEAFSR